LVRNEGLELTLSNDLLQNKGLEPILMNYQFKNEQLERILSNDQFKIMGWNRNCRMIGKKMRAGTDMVDSLSHFPMIGA
jgi:hypothetical protein